MMDVNWPNLARVLLTPRLILSKSAPWHCFAKSVRHERVRAGSCLVTQSQNTSERADNQTTSAQLSVSWTLFSYRWHVKVLPTCRQLLQPGRSPPVQYRRIYFGPALSRSASMSQSGSVCDLHSHMPAPQSARCCVVGQVTMELHGDSAAGGSDPGPLVLQRSPRLESRSVRFICRTSEFIWNNSRRWLKSVCCPVLISYDIYFQC